MQVVILGAGSVAGAGHLVCRWSSADADVVLIDQADSFVFGFSKLDVMFSRASADHVRASLR